MADGEVINIVRNPIIKQWMWQRLWTTTDGKGEVFTSMAFYENAPWLHVDPKTLNEDGSWLWLCPKPNLVLV